MSTIKLHLVCTKAEIQTVEALAKTIWKEHYVPIWGNVQVAYMLIHFQSKNAIHHQIQEGYRYYLIQNDTKSLGYFAIQLRETELFLSKIYLLSESRGKGFGKIALTFIETLAKEKNLPKISLFVNKKNHDTIGIYQKIGFTIATPIVQDIGNGFTLDDYIMEKPL